MHTCQMQRLLINNLVLHKMTISTAESATAGKIASMICDVPGASNVFKEGYIVYSNEAKIKILGIDKNIIDKYGVVSKETAEAMANNLHKITGADICVSVTGNLGPEVLEDKKAGLVYIGIYYNNNVNVETCEYEGMRLEIKEQVVNRAFELLYELTSKL